MEATNTSLVLSIWPVIALKSNPERQNEIKKDTLLCPAKRRHHHFRDSQCVFGDTVAFAAYRQAPRNGDKVHTL